jgi:hypothetical protein
VISKKGGEGTKKIVEGEGSGRKGAGKRKIRLGSKKKSTRSARLRMTIIGRMIILKCTSEKWVIKIWSGLRRL